MQEWDCVLDSVLGGGSHKKQDRVLGVNLSDAQLLNGRGVGSPFFVFLEKIYQQEIPQTLHSFHINSTHGKVRWSFAVTSKLTCESSFPVDYLWLSGGFRVMLPEALQMFMYTHVFAPKEMWGITCIFHRSGAGAVRLLELCSEGAQAGQLGSSSLAAGYQVVWSGWNWSGYVLSFGLAGNWESVL